MNNKLINKSLLLIRDPYSFLTCECNEQVIEVNHFGTQSVGRSVNQFPVNLLT